MPPNGGFGGNTGIHDGHNLAWKLAYVLKGLAGPDLPSTYEAERRPVGKFTVEQAYSRYVTRSAAYLGAKDYEPVAHDFDIEVGYLYKSPAILSEPGQDKLHELPSESLGRPGSRAPHLWVERAGRRVSTLDLFGPNFTLLAAPDGGTWAEAAKQLTSPTIDAYVVGRDVDGPRAQIRRSLWPDFVGRRAGAARRFRRLEGEGARPPIPHRFFRMRCGRC